MATPAEEGEMAARKEWAENACKQTNAKFFKALHAAKREARNLIKMLNTIGDYYKSHPDDISDIPIDCVTAQELREVEASLKELTLKIGVDALE